MAPLSSTLAWKIPWMEEPGGLQSMGSLRVGHDWATSLSLFTFMHWRRKWQPTPVFLPGESQGRGSLVGCHLWGCTESDMTEVTKQQQQQQQHIPFLLNLTPTPHPTPLGHHRAPSWAPCAIQLLPTSCLFYIWKCVYVNATLSIHPTLPFPHCAHISVLYVCVTISRQLCL